MMLSFAEFLGIIWGGLFGAQAWFGWSAILTALTAIAVSFGVAWSIARTGWWAWIIVPAILAGGLMLGLFLIWSGAQAVYA